MDNVNLLPPSAEDILAEDIPAEDISAEEPTPVVRGRPFAPGQSGNPNGRPKGARNKATIAAEALLDGEAEGLTRKALEMAIDAIPWRCGCALSASFRRGANDQCILHCLHCNHRR